MLGLPAGTRRSRGPGAHRREARVLRHQPGPGDWALLPGCPPRSSAPAGLRGIWSKAWLPFPGHSLHSRPSCLHVAVCCFPASNAAGALVAPCPLHRVSSVIVLPSFPVTWGPAGRLDSILVLTGPGTGMKGRRPDLPWLVQRRGPPYRRQTEWVWAGCAFLPVQVLTASCPSTAVMWLCRFPRGKCHTL